MKIAIAIFNSRVSPRFDCAPGIEVADIANGKVLSRTRLGTENISVTERIKKLQNAGVETLICGGIDRASEAQLDYCGIKTYSWITGKAEDALNCLLKGRLESRLMIGSGGRCRGRWRFGRGKGRGGFGRRKRS